MKKVILLLFLFPISRSLKAQEIVGDWYGKISVQGMQLRIVFHISKNGASYISTMDSPDQGVEGIPVTKTVFESSTLKLKVENLGIEYEGALKDSIISGTFEQGGITLPLHLKINITDKVSKRPQVPSKPYPYYSEDVSFKNVLANITLSGTLTLPKKVGHYPAVILISGSGPQNRDEEIAGHKPFLVISDYLTRNGIAVLRFDDRGAGKSEGNFSLTTTADFATDVESAAAYLKTRKEINNNKIGLVGHSEGGIIAAMIAARSKEISFIVLLAAPGVSGDKLLLLQQQSLAKASNVPEKLIKKINQINATIYSLVVHSKNEEKLQADVKDYLEKAIEKDSLLISNGLTKDQFIQLQIKQISTPWMRYFLSYNPASALRKVKCPVLALNGEKDLQVTPKQNLTAIEEALKQEGNKSATVEELKGLNHLFQQCKSGLPNEYITIDETFSPLALETILKWILQVTR
jgi:uncharacterized protein